MTRKELREQAAKRCAEVRAMYEQGMTDKAIALVLGISHSRAWQIRRSYKTKTNIEEVANDLG